MTVLGWFDQQEDGTVFVTEFPEKDVVYVKHPDHVTPKWIKTAPNEVMEWANHQGIPIEFGPHDDVANIYIFAPINDAQKMMIRLRWH